MFIVSVIRFKEYFPSLLHYSIIEYKGKDSGAPAHCVFPVENIFFFFLLYLFINSVLLTCIFSIPTHKLWKLIHSSIFAKTFSSLPPYQVVTTRPIIIMSPYE